MAKNLTNLVYFFSSWQEILTQSRELVNVIFSVAINLDTGLLLFKKESSYTKDFQSIDGFHCMAPFH